MKTLLHETSDVAFFLIKKDEKYYVKIFCKSRNYANIIEKIDLNLFDAVVGYFEEHSDDDIGVIVVAQSSLCSTIVSSSIVALMSEWLFAMSEDIDIYDGIRFPFRWVAIQENEGFFVVHSILEYQCSMPVGSEISKIVLPFLLGECLTQ